MTDDKMINTVARAIREEVVRQYRDNERAKCPAGAVYYEEHISPEYIARAALAAADEVRAEGFDFMAAERRIIDHEAPFYPGDIASMLHDIFVAGLAKGAVERAALVEANHKLGKELEKRIALALVQKGV